jgi:hypothetical protein
MQMQNTAGDSLSHLKTTFTFLAPFYLKKEVTKRQMFENRVSLSHFSVILNLIVFSELRKKK